MGIIFNAPYMVDCEGKATSIVNFSCMYFVLYVMMVERTTEICRREIIIKGRIMFGCCVCVELIAID